MLFQKKGQYAQKLENQILVLIKRSASSVNASNVSPNTWYVVSLHFKLLMVQKPNRTHHCYSSVVACGASEKRRAASGTFARTIQAQSKPIQTTFTYKPNQTKPNYFLVPVHSHRTKAQPVETQTDITGCKPDHQQLDLHYLIIRCLMKLNCDLNLCYIVLH